MRKTGAALILVLSLIIAALLAVGIWYRVTNQSRSTTTALEPQISSLSGIDTSNWKEYTGPQGSPRIKYPPNWYGVYQVDQGIGYIDIASVSSSDIENNNPKGSHEFSFYGASRIDEPGVSQASVTPETFLSYEQNVLALIWYGSILSTSSLTVDGKPAFEYRLASSTYDVVDILFYSTSSPGSEIAEISFDPDITSSDQKLFDAILSTVHFSN